MHITIGIEITLQEGTYLLLAKTKKRLGMISWKVFSMLGKFIFTAIYLFIAFRIHYSNLEVEDGKSVFDSLFLFLKAVSSAVSDAMVAR